LCFWKEIWVSIKIKVSFIRFRVKIFKILRYLFRLWERKWPLCPSCTDTETASVKVLTYSTCTVTEAPRCTDTETRTDTETHTDTEAASVSVQPISRPQHIVFLKTKFIFYRIVHLYSSNISIWNFFPIKFANIAESKQLW